MKTKPGFSEGDSLVEAIIRGKSQFPKEVLNRFEVTPLSAELKGEHRILERYRVEGAEVVIVDTNGRGGYLVDEPSLSPEELTMYRALMASIYYSGRQVEPADAPGVARDLLDGYTKDQVAVVSETSKEKLLYYIERDVAGYGPLNTPMRDPNLEELECGGCAAPLSVVHRQFTEYLRLQTNICLPTEALVAQTVQKLAQRAGKSVTTAYPYGDFILPEGHRGSATYSNEISLPGSTFSIRKFPESPLTVTSLLKAGTMSPLMVAYQWLVQEYRGLTLITGPVSSGKTTMLNTMVSTLHPAAKIVTVEDSPEVRIPHENWIRLITRTAYTLGAREVGLFELVKVALRYRPDYLIVGEVRGEEIQSLVQGAAVGHGALTTFHAESPEAALVRMRSPPLSVGESFLLLIWSFIQMSTATLVTGKQVRRVASVVELVPDPGALSFRLEKIFEWDSQSDSFSPGDAVEVFERSYRLRSAARLRGLTERAAIRELSDRAKLVQELVREGVFDYKEVTRRAFEYHHDKRALVRESARD